MSLKTIGEVIIFVNDIGLTSIGVSNKKQDGKYENMYLPVQFKKGIEITNKQKINIKNSFLSFYTNKENIKVLKLIIMDFEKIENSEYTTSNNDEDLPF